MAIVGTGSEIEDAAEIHFAKRHLHAPAAHRAAMHAIRLKKIVVGNLAQNLADTLHSENDLVYVPLSGYVEIRLEILRIEFTGGPCILPCKRYVESAPKKKGGPAAIASPVG